MRELSTALLANIKEICGTSGIIAFFFSNVQTDNETAMIDVAQEVEGIFLSVKVFFPVIILFYKVYIFDKKIRVVVVVLIMPELSQLVYFSFFYNGINELTKQLNMNYAVALHIFFISLLKIGFE